jgi:membrane-associated phospholipid phosphatase
MLIAYLVFFGGLGVIALVGLLLARRPETQPRSDGSGPLSSVRDRLRNKLGDHLAALAIAVPAVALTLLVMWPIGRVAKRYEVAVDLRFLKWQFRNWEQQFGTWHDIQAIVTEIGSLLVIKIVCVVAGIGFAVLWRRRRWWIPLLAFPVVFVTDKYTQLLLRHLSGRPKPFVSTLGSYPSGGCMRVITVFGVICYLTLLTWPQLSKGWRTTGWTVVGVLTFLEAYSRVFVFKHYLFDIIGGVLCGTLLLLGWVAALSCLKPRSSEPEAEPTRGHPASVAAEAG